MQFAYAESNNKGLIRFFKLNVGHAYELENGLKIVVTDVILDRIGQIVKYFYVLELSACVLLFVWSYTFCVVTDYLHVF